MRILKILENSYISLMFLKILSTFEIFAICCFRDQKLSGLNPCRSITIKHYKFWDGLYRNVNKNYNLF